MEASGQLPRIEQPKDSISEYLFSLGDVTSIESFCDVIFVMCLVFTGEIIERLATEVGLCAESLWPPVALLRSIIAVTPSFNRW